MRIHCKWLYIYSLLLTSCVSAQISITPVADEMLPRSAMPADVFQWTPIPGIYGELLYTLNVTIYGPDHSFSSWENYLALTNMSDPTQQTTTVPARLDLLYHTSGFLLRQPRFSPDGTWIAFKIGQADPACESYTLFLMNITARKLINAGSGERDSPVVWSPNNRYVVLYNGDYVAHERYWPLQIWLFDRQTGKGRKIVTENNLDASVSWTPDNHLLFGIRPDAWGRKRKTPHMAAGIYSYNPEADCKPVRIIANATQPAISPDRRWITAFQTRGTYDGADWPYERTLAIYPRHGGKPVLLPVHDHGSGTQYFWSPDSQQLYYWVQHDSDSEKTRFSLCQYILDTKKTRTICVVHGDSLDAFGISRNGNYLFYNLVQFDLEDKSDQTPSRSTMLQAIDLLTGKVVTLAKADGWPDFDWREKQ